MACIEWNYLSPLISCRFLTPSQVPVITAKPLCLNFLKISYKMVMFFIYGWFLFWFWIQMSKLHVETVDHFVHKSAISNDINLHMPDFFIKKVWFDVGSKTDWRLLYDGKAAYNSELEEGLKVSGGSTNVMA